MIVNEHYAKLKGLMREKGMTYKDMAHCLGISSTTFVAKINKKTTFSIDETKAIKELLNLSIQEYEDIFLQ